jgi:hypothetical protein
MATFTIDLLTGNEYLFNGDFSNTGSTSGIQTASNGLTKTGTNVCLGGTLISNLNINSNLKDFYISNALAFCAETCGGISGSSITLCNECVRIVQNNSSIGIEGVVNPNIYLEAFDNISGTSTSLSIFSNDYSLFRSTDGKPINYGDDYISCYTNRSLVDKEYVDNDYTFTPSGGTQISCAGTHFTIYSTVPTGTTVYWNDVLNKPNLVLTSTFSGYTGTTLIQINSKLDISTFTGYTGTTGLQEVTEINAVTNIESTFDGGLVLSKIRPTGDTITAIQVRKADGTTPVINIDTISGFTGFGTTAPKGLIHLYGTDNSAGDGWNLQSNNIRLDGNTNVDKDIVWMDNGVDKWAAQIFRSEEGKYWYLYDVKDNSNTITASNTGRIGINNPTNVMNYHAILVSGGPNDMNVGGNYTLNYTSLYKIEINCVTGATDTFRWQVSLDNGITFSIWSLSTGCTTGATLIQHGVTIQFNNITGHTSGTTWLFGAFAQLPVGTFVISTVGFTEVQKTNDYTAGVIEYTDITAEANSATLGGDIIIFNTGVTKNAIYFGTKVKIDALYVNLLTVGASMIIITEYLNSSSGWTVMTTANNYIDNTNNLTQSGDILWDSTLMTDWIPEYMQDLVESNYELYWVRLRTSTNPTIAPIANNFARGGNYKLAVLTSPNDIRPSFYIDSLGRVSIGGGNLTDCNRFQINSKANLGLITGTGDVTSIVEIDSECSKSSDIKIKLATNDSCSGGITMLKIRGTLENPLDTCIGDSIGHISFVGGFNGCAVNLTYIDSRYMGLGSGDIVFSTAINTVITESVRMSSSGTTGFGVSCPTATAHLKAGTTSFSPLKFNSGSLLSLPQIGAVEFLGDAWYGTPTGGTRKTFTFLESPQFSGNVGLPDTTCLNNTNLCTYILQSGGTNNDTLYKTCSFNAYTASTQMAICKAITGATNGICRTNCHDICLGGVLVSPLIICGNEDICLHGERIDFASSAGAQIWDKNGCNIEFYSSGGTVTIKGMTSTGCESMRFQISNSQATFTDSRSGSTRRGVEYDNDYSSTFGANSLVSKTYVDTHSGGIFPKEAVEVATIACINLASAPATIGGVTLTNGMRILVKNQGVGITGSTTNGIYDFNGAGSGMTRSSDFVSGITQVVNGSYVAVISGVTNQNTSWILSTPNPITVGVTPLVFVFFASTIGVVAGNGICSIQTGGNYNISVNLASNCGLCVDASGLYLNSNIAGTGLNYTSGVLSVCGSNLAGNSLSWTGNSFNVDITSGTLSTTLNSKLNTSIYCSYTGTTASDINSRALKSSINTYTGTTAPTTFTTKAAINTFTGTTLPANYYNKTQINIYTGVTATAIGLKAPITSPTFLISACSVKPAQNDNTICIATTSWYISQGATANALMDGTAGCGTSNLFARQDHVHPSDTSRVIKAGDTMTGALIINSNLTVTGTTILRGKTCLGIPAVSSVATGHTLFWNPTTCAIQQILLTGGSDNYHYKECATPTSSASGTCIKFLGYTATTFTAGRYQIDYNVTYGNSNSNGCSLAQFNLDGTVVGRCTGAQLQYANYSVVTSLSRDVNLIAGTHCFDIYYWAGSNTACIWYGAVRAKRIC